MFVPMSGELADLALLACGRCGGNTPLASVLSHLSGSLQTVLDEAFAIMEASERTPPGRVTLYGPFLGRSVLELTATALIARTDPFRALVLSEIQKKPVPADRRNSVAIQWSGDVLAKAKVPPDKLWSVDQDPATHTRALLGDYWEHLLWRPAFQRLADHPDTSCGGEWLRTLRRVPPEGIGADLRRRCVEAFSRCSKGVHHEFLVPVEKFNSPSDVVELLVEVLETATILAALASIADHVHFNSTIAEVATCAERIQSALDQLP